MARLQSTSSTSCRLERAAVDIRKTFFFLLLKLKIYTFAVRCLRYFETGLMNLESDYLNEDKGKGRQLHIYTSPTHQLIPRLLEHDMHLIEALESRS